MLAKENSVEDIDHDDVLRNLPLERQRELDERKKTLQIRQRLPYKGTLIKDYTASGRL